MDADVGRWSLEFLVGKRMELPKTLIRKIVRSIPFTLSQDYFRSRNTLVLDFLQHHLSNASISEDMLEKLEVLEEFHRAFCFPLPPTMPAAYCSIALECTLKYLLVEPSPSKNPPYLDAVHRIWRGRVRHMDPSLPSSRGGSQLFSPELKRWSSDIEASLCDPRLCESLSKVHTRREAIQKLRVFLAEASGEIGPSFLEFAASLPTASAPAPANRHEMELGPRGSPQHPVGVTVDPLPDDALHVELPVKDVNWEPSIQNHITDAHNENQITDEQIENQTTDAQTENQNTNAPVENQSVNAPLENQCTDLPIGNQTADVPIENQRTDAPNKNLTADAPNKNQTADAPNMDQTADAPKENQSADADFHEQHFSQTTNNNDVDDLTKTTTAHQSDVNRPSLMVRNNTAHTSEWDSFKWDESADGLQAGTSNPANRIHLPSPKRKKISPLKNYEPGHIMKRRRRKRWSELEEETLKTAVKEIGEGNWKSILTAHQDIFEGRTQVDLKDKWRNLTRYGAK